MFQSGWRIKLLYVCGAVCLKGDKTQALEKTQGLSSVSVATENVMYNACQV